MAVGAGPGEALGDLSLVFRKKKKSVEAPLLEVPIADTHAHLTCFWDMEPPRALARAAVAGDRLLVTLFDPVADPYAPDEFGRFLESWLSAARALLDAAGGTPAALPDGTEPPALLERVRYLVGVHPYGAADYTGDVEDALRGSLRDPRCVGIGEIGLDYHFDADDDIDPAPHDVQISCMERQISLALELDVPIELHLRNDVGDESREAHADAYRVLSRMGIPDAGCVLHCFGEDRETMERFLELGCHIAFGGAATFKRNDAVREAFASCPEERILFETDCPYMAPEPIRGLECEPAMIAFTIDALARDRAARTGEDPSRVMRAAWNNAVRLFDRP